MIAVPSSLVGVVRFDRPARVPPPGGGTPDLGEGLGGSVDQLARAIDAHEQLGFDDLIVQLAPKTPRSLDRLAEALELRAH
jgi:hypothetical protein